MERSDWSDDEPFAFRPPLPPEDRVWRHPSELGATGGPTAPFAPATRPISSGRGRIALAVAVGATGVLLIGVIVASALRSSDGSPSALVEPTPSTLTFAPTTVGDLPELGRPADGAVHLVATTSSGEQRVSAGVVLDGRGTIATTMAAIAGAQTIIAYLADGTRQPARLLGVDAGSGAAVLRVSALPLAASSGWAVLLHPGDQVHAGTGPNAEVIDLGVEALAFDGHALAHLVQLSVDGDDPVVEGTPLFDAHEQVVGLATHDKAGNVFALPIEIPRAAARSISVHGRIVVPWLGVTGDDDGDDSGAIVRTVVAGSPADKVGLQPGDVIVSMDGQPIGSMAVLALSLRDYDAGATIDLAYTRGGLVRHAGPVLVERPAA